MNRDQVIVCGVFAHHGVMVGCIDGYTRNFQMTMVADALGDYSEPGHRMVLQYVAQMCGAANTVRRVEGLLAAGSVEYLAARKASHTLAER